MERPSTA